MKVFKKPAGADWSSKSAKMVDEVRVQTEPWTESISISFSTSDENTLGENANIRIALTEDEVEDLFFKLNKGKREALNYYMKRSESIIAFETDLYGKMTDAIENHEDKNDWHYIIDMLNTRMK